MSRNMYKVSPDFLPDIDHQRYEELRRQFTAKQIAWLEAQNNGKYDLADQIVREKDHLLTELRMINPGIELTDLEMGLIQEAEALTKQRAMVDDILRRDEELKKNAS